MTIAASAVLLGGIFALGFGDEMIAFAAKPQNNGAGKDVIANSNGFPSGPHFNLIIHGKESFDSSNCADAGGKSVFTPLYSNFGEETLQMFANKKASLSNLVVKDKCTEGFDSDPAQVQIPTKIETDEGLVDITDGMYVFARVHGTPNNDKGEPSNIALWPDPNIEACNLNATATTINGSVPGPLIRLQEGQNITLKVTNHLKEASSIHWHGILLPPDMDGVPGVSFAGIDPGTTFEYQFPIKQSGTYW